MIVHFLLAVRLPEGMLANIINITAGKPLVYDVHMSTISWH
jgi:hypothetical protein